MRTGSAGSEARGASSGRMYSGNTLQSEDGSTRTHDTQRDTHQMDAARTRASGAWDKYIWGYGRVIGKIIRNIKNCRREHSCDAHKMTKRNTHSPKKLSDG